MLERLEATIAVCTYNRAELLQQALGSLLTLRTRRRFEIVVVDNDSTDETSRVIADVAHSAPVSVRGFKEIRRGITFARNRAVAEAQGEWIAFFDDDQVADPDWLEQLFAIARERKTRCVGGRVTLMYPESVRNRPSPLCRAMLGETLNMTTEQRYTWRQRPGSGNLMIHHSVFKIVGTFDDSFAEGGSDNNLFLRIRAAGMDAWYTPSAHVRHVIHDYRLGKRYLLTVSRRNGWNAARIEKGIVGKSLLPFTCLARLGRSFIALLPWRGRSPVPSARERRFEFRCLLTRTLGYAQYTLNAWAPSVVPKERFSDSINFRNEREIFPTAHDGPSG